MAAVAALALSSPCAVAAATQPSVAQWSALVNCESGHRNISNGVDSGFFQFDNTTWEAVTGLPGPASSYPALVQWAAAIQLYQQRGAQPWPYCGRFLG